MSSDSSSEDESSTRILRKPQKRRSTKLKKSKVLMNIADTKYKVVKSVGKKGMGYTLVTGDEEWDICWTDVAVQPEQLARMKGFQRINHFPGMYTLSRKNYLGRNLMKMKKEFPLDYDFFPSTFILPTDSNEMTKAFAGKKKTFILKPEASCQGRGIILIRSVDEIPVGERYVAQRYIHKPYLIDNLKFDLRVYVLITSCSPMRIYVYKEGLARFATEPYKAPSRANINNHFIHLTNYAVNKKNPQFQFNEEEEKADKGHKRSFASIFEHMKEAGLNPSEVWERIKNMIVKAFCGVQPILEHTYKSCQPNNPEANMCFELLGFTCYNSGLIFFLITEEDHFCWKSITLPVSQRTLHSIGK